MDDIFSEAMNVLSGDVFEERPVDVETFVQSEQWMNQPPLSEYQYQIIKAGSQIYYEDTLIQLLGEEAGLKRWEETYNEIVLALGKGSGKDHCSQIMCLYLIYLLLCLKDPQKYYGKPPGDAIDIMNVAVNAQQANRVFFKGLVEKLKRCQWLYERADIKSGEVNFNKNINLISGHSESESLEGYNVIMVVLDEISGFALDVESGNQRAKTADSIYLMHRNSVDSRFSDVGKIVALSFTRFKGDYISQMYDNIVAEKEVIIRKHTFKIDPNLPDNFEGNEFTIEWKEDHIIRYELPKLWALKRPSWEVNPTKNIGMYMRAFLTNPSDALARYACDPQDNVESSFFKNHTKIDESFVASNGVDENGYFRPDFRPIVGMKYYVHVDLAKVHDRCAVGMAHVDKWIKSPDENFQYSQPVVVVDAVRWWQPSKTEPMDYKRVQDYIMELRRRGFDIKMVTFDRWESFDIMNALEERHVHTDRLSVANKHYDDFLSVMYDGRLRGPRIEELITELKELRYIKDKVDHPTKGYKDISDAVCGSIFNAVSLTGRPIDTEVEILTYADIIERNKKEAMTLAAERGIEEVDPMKSGVIRVPKRDMPDEITEYMNSMRVL